MTEIRLFTSFLKIFKIIYLVGVIFVQTLLFFAQTLSAETNNIKTDTSETSKTLTQIADTSENTGNTPIKETDFFDYTHTFYREIKTKNSDKKSGNTSGNTTEIKREYVKQTVPGEELLAVINYTYNKEAPLQEVVFTLPIPKETIYVNHSATDEKDIWFSSDNQKNWSKLADLNVTESDGTKRVATTKDITHLQWRMKKTLNKGDKGILEYKVIIR